VAIPANVKMTTFSFDIDLKNTPGNNTNNAAVVGIYSTAMVPNFSDITVVGGVNGKINYFAPSDVMLQSRLSSTFDISTRAGTTVRFAIINAVNNTGYENIGIDNVKFTVTLGSIKDFNNDGKTDIPTRTSRNQTWIYERCKYLGWSGSTACSLINSFHFA
jgi:hypothetical protein